ncbi:fungal specific transcription factor domain-containing protein [Aspergillus tanneri]|uniref:Transcription factor domain-containing protein n=1 Tax=Aspergillus tanneri TaxID=1220188 RepID=A0A5M9MRB1_9EURO|nr:uncharacterized protein ATNIH1004_002109 [Aspergillus tanneri]KAA8649438.1 hypothetical protein ATNIH1004_002109 [Aspergillus tanneri]
MKSPIQETSPPSEAVRNGFERTEGLVDPSLVQGCAEYFFARMAGTVPILSLGGFQRQVESMNQCLHAYCLVTAFCAFVVTQTGYPSHHQAEPSVGLALLEEATVARRQLDPFSESVRRSITIAFLLYGCHIGQGHQRRAYYYLREATTLYTAGMLDEEHDQDWSASHDQLFWLLLISERAHAIRRRRPITLQIGPSSPPLADSLDPFTIGFNCLVKLYRLFDKSFLDLWNGTQTTWSREALIHLEEHVQRAVPVDIQLPDILLADLLVSQQWLRTIIWQLATRAGFLSTTPIHPCLEFRYPLQIARDLAMATWKLSMGSMETHGVGLIEKIFEVACTLTDVMVCVSTTGLQSSAFELGPQDYLKHFCFLIATLPGGRSRFLPLLLTKIEQTTPAMLEPVQMHLNLSEENPSDLPGEAKSHEIHLQCREEV